MEEQPSHEKDCTELCGEGFRWILKLALPFAN
jgi:hypothetical protein